MTFLYKIGRRIQVQRDFRPFQICTWSIDTWEKKNSFPLQLTTSESCSACTGDTRVQFHCDEIQFLVSHGTQLALYDVENVDHVQRVHDTTTYAKLF